MLTGISPEIQIFWEGPVRNCAVPTVIGLRSDLANPTLGTLHLQQVCRRQGKRLLTIIIVLQYYYSTVIYCNGDSAADAEDLIYKHCWHVLSGQPFFQDFDSAQIVTALLSVSCIQFEIYHSKHMPHRGQSKRLL